MCPKCKTLSHRSSYAQQLHTISAAALRLQRQMEAEAGEPTCSLAQLLQGIEAQHVKSCDKDVGALLGPPILGWGVCGCVKGHSLA